LTAEHDPGRVDSPISLAGRQHDKTFNFRFRIHKSHQKRIFYFARAESVAAAAAAAVAATAAGHVTTRSPQKEAKLVRRSNQLTVVLTRKIIYGSNKLNLGPV
jgi:hypothetical protein